MIQNTVSLSLFFFCFVFFSCSHWNDIERQEGNGIKKLKWKIGNSDLCQQTGQTVVRFVFKMFFLKSKTIFNQKEDDKNCSIKNT